MIRRITTLVVAAMLMLAMAVPAFAAPKSCSENSNGCKTNVVATQDAGASGGFTLEEEQRGNTSAKGTTSTETVTCENPGGQSEGSICRGT
jgi:hypothetical protein